MDAWAIRVVRVTDRILDHAAELGRLFEPAADHLDHVIDINQPAQSGIAGLAGVRLGAFVVFELIVRNQVNRAEAIVFKAKFGRYETDTFLYYEAFLIAGEEQSRHLQHTSLGVRSTWAGTHPPRSSHLHPFLDSPRSLDMLAFPTRQLGAPMHEARARTAHRLSELDVIRDRARR